MIEETMRNELKDVLDAGYTLDIGYLDEEKTHFYFYLHSPDKNRKKSIYGHMLPREMSEREIAFGASYFLLGTLEGRGKINMEKVTT